MPRDTEAEKAERRKAMHQALAGATEPPVLITELAIRLVTLAEALLPVGNRNVIRDVAAAATARVNVEINVASLNEPAVQRRCEEIVSRVDDAPARAEAVTDAARENQVSGDHVRLPPTAVNVRTSTTGRTLIDRVHRRGCSARHPVARLRSTSRTARSARHARAR